MECFLCCGNSTPQVFLAGSVQVENINKHFKRKPIDYILYIITDGEMHMNEGGREYALKKGDLIIFDPSRTHYGLETMSDVSYIYIHFKWEGINEFFMDEKLFADALFEKSFDFGYDKIILPKLYTLPHIYFEELVSLAQRITEEFNGREKNYRILAGSMLLQLLSRISRSYFENDLERFEKKDDVIYDLLNFIKYNFKSRFTGKDIEKKFNMNYDYLNRQFKKRTGMTIMDYTNRYRVEEGKKMLRSGAYNVSSTADELGFVNEFYFSRVFKKYEGVSPSSFLLKL